MKIEECFYGKKRRILMKYEFEFEGLFDMALLWHVEISNLHEPEWVNSLYI